MKRFALISILLASTLLLIATGSGLAHDEIISQEGKTVIHVDAEAVAAAKAYNARMDSRLDTRGYLSSEIGPEIVASPKALLAAKLYRYDQPEAFAKKSDEAGTSYFASEHQSAEVKNAIANWDKMGGEGTICLTC